MVDFYVEGLQDTCFVSWDTERTSKTVMTISLFSTVDFQPQILSLWVSIHAQLSWAQLKARDLGLSYNFVLVPV